MPDIPAATAAKSPSEIVRERAAKRRRETWKRKNTARLPKKKVRSNATSLRLGRLRCAQVSQATRQRLISEAIQSPAFQGMEPAEVAAFVNQKIDAYCPWWYGGLSTDRPKRERTEAQRMAFEKVRQRKAEIQQEVEAPYVPNGLDQGTESAY